MNIVFDPILGKMRWDYSMASAAAVTVTGGTASLASVAGGKRYVLADPVKNLVIGSVPVSPQETEIVFTAYTEASKAVFEMDFDVWGPLDLDRIDLDLVSGTGDSRVFRCTTTNYPPDDYQEQNCEYTFELKKVSGTWKILVEYETYPIENDDEAGSFVNWEGTPTTGSGTLLTQTGGTTLETATWGEFNCNLMPNLSNATIRDSGYSMNFDIAMPTISLPASLGVINMPDFGNGSYIINIRNGIAVGAEYTPGETA